jgi:isoamylase
MSLSIELNKGQTFPLGASVLTNGVNFAVYAPLAKQLYVCLFDASGHTEVLKLAMNNNEGGIWSLHITPLAMGTLYGYRAEGEYQPKKC